MEADRLKHHPIASTGCSGPLSAGVQDFYFYFLTKVTKGVQEIWCFNNNNKKETY
jgi:hypothetical protein